MSAPAPALSVVIPTYNAAGLLPEQLAALARQTTREPFEVLVADNGSTDGSARVAAAWTDRLPGLRVVDASRARGVSAARNDGIRAAATGRVAICDADDLVSEGWVAAMAEALRRHSFVGGALDVTRLNGPAAQAWVPVPPRSVELPRTWGGRRYAFGGNLGLRRDVFEATGGFDESYGAGAEEIDFAWRAADAGFTPVFAPDAVIHYRLREDLRGVLRQQYHSGVGTTHVFSRFRPGDVVVRSWHRRLRHELALLRRFPWRGDAVDRGAWLSTLAFEAGKVRGAVRYRCPVP